MTNAEAIKIINQYDCNFYWTDGEKIPTEDLIEAFELAVKALEEQEPRVLTLEEVMNSDAPVVVDYYDMPLCYASFERDVSSKKWARFYTFGEEDFIKLLIDDYNKRNTWRCWSAKPSDEQMDGTPWEK